MLTLSDAGMVVAIIGSVDNIEFIKETDTEAVSHSIAARLDELSSQQAILWLVPGGSAAQIAALTSRQLHHPQNIYVSLTDERYGEVGHRDSNWRLLKEAGFKFPPDCYEILATQPFDIAVKKYSDYLGGAVQAKVYKTALLGMGADGHIAGLLPNSPGVNSDGWAVGYHGSDFQRISISGKFILELDEAFVYTTGQPKHAQIKKIAEELSPEDQPAQLMKRLPRVQFYNDFKGR